MTPPLTEEEIRKKRRRIVDAVNKLKDLDLLLQLEQLLQKVKLS